MRKNKETGLDIEALTGSVSDLGALTGAVSLGITPDLESLIAGPPEPAEDPFAGTEYTGSLEQDTAIELTDLQKAYRDRAKAEAKRFKHATDSEFWFAVCFRDRASKEKFLRDYGLIELGDKFIDGHQAAKVLPKPKR